MAHLNNEAFFEKIAQSNFPNITKCRQRQILDFIEYRLAQDDLVIISRVDYERLLKYEDQDFLKDPEGPLY